jgi:hypothetical protein
MIVNRAGSRLYVANIARLAVVDAMREAARELGEDEDAEEEKRRPARTHLARRRDD